jgi:site-specific DNA recombinase
LKAPRGQKNGGSPEKRCGLVIRVSTDGQARNPEGSLTNQLQRLQAHIEYKAGACGESWIEAAQYTLPAISGAKSLRSAQFAQLFEDIRTGRVNTVLCTALDRICRSVKDFLEFFEFLNQHDVEFVCLKQNYDTTSPQGRLFIMIMMALAQFEREQTAERNRDSSLARAERGLWNGGHLLGYDLPPENQRGTLIPNEAEAAVVNAAFDIYLETGSINETVKVLNERGYRTKEYGSRRGKHHPAGRFYWTPVRWMLMNYAYIGMKEVNKKRRHEDPETLPEARRYRLVEARWPGIVPEEKFYAAQKLLEANDRTKHNQIKSIRHCYLFNHGLLWCGDCGKQMEGRSGTGHQRKRYYYYVCKVCGKRVSANVLTDLVLERIRVLAAQPEILRDLVAETNRQLETELPKMEDQRTALEKQLEDVKSAADGLLNRLAGLKASDTGALVTEKLDALAQRRRELEAGVAALDLSIDQIRRDAVDEDQVREALAHTAEVFEALPPYRKKELIRLVLTRAEVTRESLKLAFRGRPPALEVLQGKKNERGANTPRSETPEWLPKRNPLRNLSMAPQPQPAISLPFVLFRSALERPVFPRADEPRPTATDRIPHARSRPESILRDTCASPCPARCSDLLFRAPETRRSSGAPESRAGTCAPRRDRRIAPQSPGDRS